MFLSVQATNDNTQYWLEFYAKIADTLAWPLVFICIFFVLFFKRNSILKYSSSIIKILKHTKSVKVGNAEINFTDELYQVNEKLLENNDSSTESNPVSSFKESENNFKQYFSPDKDFNELASINPDLAILDSWRVVENEIKKTYHYFNIEPDITRTSDYVMLKILLKTGKISKNQFLFISRLKGLRNEVTHNKNSIVSYSDAETYRMNCFEAVQILQNSTKTQPSPPAPHTNSN